MSSGTAPVATPAGMLQTAEGMPVGSFVLLYDPTKPVGFRLRRLPIENIGARIIPPGGLKGYVLAKASDADYDVTWVKPSLLGIGVAGL